MKKENNPLATVYHCDLFGKRDEKYDFLNNNSLDSIEWAKLENREPQFFFVPKDFELQQVYDTGFSVKELFPLNSSGIKTHRDHFVIDINKDTLSQRIKKFFDTNFTDQEIRTESKLKDNRDWCLAEARKAEIFNQNTIRKVFYRPFDYRYSYYNSIVIDFDRSGVMKHLVINNNIASSCQLSYFCHSLLIFFVNNLYENIYIYY